MKKVSNDEILWAKVNENAIIPTKSEENAGYDIYACFDEDYVIIEPLQTKLIPTGIACALNSDYYLQLQERGSTGSKGIKYGAGVIDSGYRGEIFVPITNCNNKPLVITKNDKNITALTEDYIIYPYIKGICQGVIHNVPRLQSKEISYEELCEYDSIRGDGSLGSSGK